MKAQALLFVVMALSSSGRVANATQVRSFSDVAIPPYEVGQAVSFSYTFKTFQTETVSFSANLTCGTYSNVLIYTRPSVVVPLIIKDTLTLPGAFLPLSSATLKLTATGTAFSVLRTLTLTAKSHSVIDSGSLADGIYTASGRVATVSSDGALVYFSETLEFTGFQEYYETFAYHRLALPDWSFAYQNGWGYALPTTLEAEFYLSDPLSLFPNLPYDSSQQARHLNGQFTKSVDGLFHFALTDSLFVDPTTLMMSVIQSPGYLGTSFLYFPKNHFTQLRTVSARLRVATFGMNALSLDFLFHHDATYSFFGSCAQDAYCLVVNEDAYDLGYDNTIEENTDA